MLLEVALRGHLYFLKRLQIVLLVPFLDLQESFTVIRQRPSDSKLWSLGVLEAVLRVREEHPRGGLRLTQRH